MLLLNINTMKMELVFSAGRWWPLCVLTCCLMNVVTATPARPKPSPGGGGPETLDFNLGQNGDYRFDYATGDAGQHYHRAIATPDNTVRGQYGYRDPKTGGDLQTTYTAGKRGFRVRGPHIARRMDLSQTKIPYNPPVTPDSPQYNPSYSTYFDPNEDPSYSFNFQTRDYSRSESSDSKGDVNGRYTFVDDVGVRHNVEYEAGSKVGFHVKTPFPDSTPLSPSVFFAGPPANRKSSKPLRGHTSILRGKDGSYRFTSAGPDQRRTEVSDATGHVKGSYTYIDDKGVQRTTQYIAGPNIGYKVISSKTDERYPVYPYPPPYPFIPSSSPFKDDDLFEINTAASGSGGKPQSGATGTAGSVGKGEKESHPDYSGEDSGQYDGSSEGSKGRKPGGSDVSGTGAGQTNDPWPDIYEYDQNTMGPTTSKKPDDFTDIFGQPPGTGLNKHEDEDEDNYDHEVGPSKGDDSGSFLQTRPPPSNIPYGNCCKFVQSHGAAKFNVQGERRHSRQPDGTTSIKSYSHVRDYSSQGQDSDDFVGFPPGLPVRGHVLSLDLKPYGSKIPSPGVAIEHFEANKSRREASSTSKTEEQST
ncbi:uncharacterized protein LOC111874413 [Cryptotermes secundus]|nr:uncharacterized protein LOC111874413 [Cryptotermes secundus]